MGVSRVNKWILGAVICFTLLLFGAPPIFASPQVQLNGVRIVFSVQPVIANGRTLVPVRAIFQALGASVDWNEQTETITSTKGDTTISLTVGSNSAILNNRSVQLDEPPEIIDGSTMVPLRFISEAFGATVNSTVTPDGTLVISINLNNTAGPTAAHLQVQSGNQSIGDGQQMQLWLDQGQEAWVSFDASGSTGPALSYLWQIDGNQVNATDQFSYQLAAGSHQVTLYAIDNQGQTSSASATVVVSVTGSSTEVAPVHFSGIQTADRDLQWTYNGVSYKWHVEVPDDAAQGYNLLQWDRQVNKDLSMFYSSDTNAQNGLLNTVTADENALILADATTNNGDLTAWVNDASNAPWVGDLAGKLGATAKTVGYDNFHEAEFVQSFVGNAIPFKQTAFPELAAQTLIDNGSRTDKSILLAGLLNSLGYKVALLYFSGTSGGQGHMAVGVVLNDNQVPDNRTGFYAYNGSKYYRAETDGSQLGAAGKETPAYIYAVSQAGVGNASSSTSSSSPTPLSPTSGQ